MTEKIKFSDFSDLRVRIKTLPVGLEDIRQKATDHQEHLTKPAGSLGKLETLAIWLCEWQGQVKPRLDHVSTLVFAGNHGITRHGVSPYPSTVTRQMVANFESGGAAINQLCNIYGSTLTAVPLNLEELTEDFTSGPAMTEADCIEMLNCGAASVAPDADLLLLGEMGIGNSTVSAALCNALFGGGAEEWAGAGTGLDKEGVLRKAEVVRQGIDRHRNSLSDAFEVLRCLGGREQAALVGAILAARLLRIPVLLDGYICCAAAAVLYSLNPHALDHCQVGHLSREYGHGKLLQNLGKEPVLDLEMGLGEGTGAAVALGVLRGAVACHNGMATFDSAGVDRREDQ